MKKTSSYPNDWREVTLADLVDITHGFPFKGEFINDKPQGDILLTPRNFTIGGGFKSNKFKYYSGSFPEEYILSDGDLIVSMTDLSKQSDTLGYPAILPVNQGSHRYLHNQRIGKIHIKDPSLETRYIYYVMCGHEYRSEVLASSTGTAIKHTSPSRIKKFRFRLAPPPEQRAISYILGTLDDKIESNRRMNETLEAMAQAIFKDWFIDFAPVKAKMAGHEPYLSPELWELFPNSLDEEGKPAGWEICMVRDCFTLTMGQSPPSETYNENGDGLPFFQGSTDFGFRYPKNRKYCTDPSRIAEKNYTLVSVRAPVGDINKALGKCCIGRGVAALCHKSGNSSYTYYSTWRIQQKLREYEDTGTVFGSINKKQFETLSILQPSANIIVAFESLICPIDDYIRKNFMENLTLTQTRDLILPKLLSGEIRISDFEKILEAIV